MYHARLNANFMTVNVTQIKNRISANVDMGAKMKKI